MLSGSGVASCAASKRPPMGGRQHVAIKVAGGLGPAHFIGAAGFAQDRIDLRPGWFPSLAISNGGWSRYQAGQYVAASAARHVVDTMERGFFGRAIGQHAARVSDEPRQLKPDYRLDWPIDRRPAAGDRPAISPVLSSSIT